MAWSGIEPATSKSRVRRPNHFATLPLFTHYLMFGSSKKKVCQCVVSASSVQMLATTFGVNTILLQLSLSRLSCAILYMPMSLAFVMFSVLCSQLK
ncbi:hypothetical protein ElyMa_006378500 [Elysia marginata]|uniref:Uncharacterized protein n=1 Tax=Elysia marginata TaxID=1093978 RepID=A0AAV4HN80_9GAST|nr:hypothetical protein ElyMa_006378500 [Elysia marginata]